MLAQRRGQSHPATASGTDVFEHDLYADAHVLDDFGYGEIGIVRVVALSRAQAGATYRRKILDDLRDRTTG